MLGPPFIFPRRILGASCSYSGSIFCLVPLIGTNRSCSGCVALSPPLARNPFWSLHRPPPTLWPRSGVSNGIAWKGSWSTRKRGSTGCPIPTFSCVTWNSRDASVQHVPNQCAPHHPIHSAWWKHLLLLCSLFLTRMKKKRGNSTQLQQERPAAIKYLCHAAPQTHV